MSVHPLQDHSVARKSVSGLGCLGRRRLFLTSKQWDKLLAGRTFPGALVLRQAVHIPEELDTVHPQMLAVHPVARSPSLVLQTFFYSQD